jgi:hypothetical protein
MRRDAAKGKDLAAALDGGRDEFGDFDAGAIELGAQRFGVGVDGGFGGAVSGHEGEGEEANAGADGNDGASATRE